MQVKKIPVLVVQFPHIPLNKSDAPALRGYFGTLFKDHSPLLHNHFDDGKLRYRYPLVQYKIIRQTPTLIGLFEGAQLLQELFLKVDTLKIKDRVYPVLDSHMRFRNVSAGVTGRMKPYRFINLWLALNQENYKKFKAMDNPHLRNQFLNRLLTANILSFFKGIDLIIDPDLMIQVAGSYKPHITHFKKQRMIGFSGVFHANCLLPDFIGLGKAVSRGFGTVYHLDDSAQRTKHPQP